MEDQVSIHLQDEVKRKVYISPELIEYGNIDTLTLGATGPVTDSAGSRPSF